MLKSIKKIFKSNIIVQVVGLAIIPLMALKFSLEDLGLYGFIFSSSSFLGNFLCLRIENSFFSSSIKKIKELLFTITFISLFIFFTSAFIILIFNLEYYYILIIYGGTTIALFNLFYNFNVRIGVENKYNRQKIFRAILELISIIIVIIFDLNIYIAILLNLSTYLIFLLNNMRIKLNLKEYIFYLRSNKKIIFSDLGSTVLVSSYIQAPMIFLGTINLKVAGLYFFIQKFVIVPSLMIAQSIGTVVKQYGANEYEKNKNIFSTFNYLKGILFKLKFIFLLGILLSLVIFYFIDKFLYEGLFQILIIIFPLIIIRFLHLSYSSIVYVLKLQTSYLFMNFFLFLTVVLSKTVSMDNEFIFLIMYSFLGSIIYFIYFIYFYIFCKRGCLV